MKKLFAVLVLVALGSPCSAQDSGPSELTGIVRRNRFVSLYYLDVDGTKISLGLKGKVLRDLSDGTRVWVRGRIKSELYRQPPPGYAGQISSHTQWHIFMQVSEFRRISEPFAIPREKEQQNH